MYALCQFVLTQVSQGYKMCTKPVTAFINPDGGRPLFGHKGDKAGTPKIKFPCGKCPECCKDYYTSWTTRGFREIMRWESSLFVTLTYNDEHLPKNRSLNKKHVQDFLKRLKKHFGSSKENPIRQSYCGEYGEKTKRPHYHLIIYNLDFADKVEHYKTDQGHQVYRSPTLESLWTFGHSEFGYATPATIAYLYKYILKKVPRSQKTRPLKLEFEGQIYNVSHEFIESSRNPGIGAHMRGSDSLKKGFLTIDGVKKKLPKYYLEWLRLNDPDTYDKIQNLKFDFQSKKEVESDLRLEQKTQAQKALTDTKKRD